MTTPILSILIPSRNRGKYLFHAITSCLEINDNDIEIIVSDNFSADNSYNVANSFNDKRLRVLRPERPLAMHEHWDFLLTFANGEWITFIGDDDAVMPHVAKHLRYISEKYQGIEGLVSPRAYLFWESAYVYGEKTSCHFKMTHKELIKDSKTQLKLCMANKINYLELPQMYSGGFQRRSLVKRVMQAQGGYYFKSATPDAYSALMGVLHTYRYLEVGVPLTWVGTSPSHSYNGLIECTKDHQRDFVDMFKTSSITMNYCLGDRQKWWPFGLYFYESYISAAPFTDLSLLSCRGIQRLSNILSEELMNRGLTSEAYHMAMSLGVQPLNHANYKLRRRLGQLRIKFLALNARVIGALSSSIAKFRPSRRKALPQQFEFSSNSLAESIEDVAHANSIASQYYSKLSFH